MAFQSAVGRLLVHLILTFLWNLPSLNPMKKLQACTIYKDFFCIHKFLLIQVMNDTLLLVFTWILYKDFVQFKNTCKGKKICTNDISS